MQHGTATQAIGSGRAVENLVTTAGPEALGFVDHPPDYQHYREKQLEPVADGILFFLGTSFSAIVDGQIALF